MVVTLSVLVGKLKTPKCEFLFKFRIPFYQILLLAYAWNMWPNIRCLKRLIPVKKKKKSQLQKMPVLCLCVYYLWVLSLWNSADRCRITQWSNRRHQTKAMCVSRLYTRTLTACFQVNTGLITCQLMVTHTHTLTHPPHPQLILQ